MTTRLIAAFILTFGASAAIAQTANPPLRPTTQSVVPRRIAPAANENSEARQKEEARQKRWDERMRRATGSMCDRC